MVALATGLPSRAADTAGQASPPKQSVVAASSATPGSMQLLGVLGEHCRWVVQRDNSVNVDQTMAGYNAAIATIPFADASPKDLNDMLAEIRRTPTDERTAALANYEICVFEARLKQLGAAANGVAGNDRILKHSNTAGAEAIRGGLTTAEQWDRDLPVREAKAKADEEAYQAALRSLQADYDRAEAKAARDKEREARGGSFNWGALASAVLVVADAYVEGQAAAAGSLQTAQPSMASAPSESSSYAESPAYSSPSPSVAHNPANEASSCLTAIDANTFEAQGVRSTQGAVFRNKCPYSVEVTWCVVGADCNPGFSNLMTVQGNSDRGISYDASRPGSISFSACRNGFTRAQSQLSPSMQHACN